MAHLSFVLCMILLVLCIVLLCKMRVFVEKMAGFCGFFDKKGVFCGKRMCWGCWCAFLVVVCS